MALTALDRRRLLQVFGSTGLLAALGACADPAPVSTPQPVPTAAADTSLPVLVIGAGIAGLNAARTLTAAGVPVIVLEGRDRIGGRVWTDRTWEDIPLDLGASWIHGVVDNPIAGWAKKLGLETVASDYDNVEAYDVNGRALSDRDWERLEEVFDDVMAAAAAAAEEIDGGADDRPLGEAIAEAAAAWELSPRQSRLLTYVVNTIVEHEYAADVDDLSLAWWDNDGAFGGDQVIFPNGYGEIADALAAGLDIRLGQVVSRVAWDDDRVTVTTAAGVEFAGRAAIITLPLGVLQVGTVAFTPPLPQAKQDAIARLGSGVLNKTYLRFAAIFWDEEAELIGYASEEKGEWCEFLNLAYYTGAPVLLGFNAGRHGAAIESLSDAEIVTGAMTTLRTIYGDDIPDPAAFQITRWLGDPLARGSYSYAAVGSTPDDRRTLAAPMGGWIFFAGEATHPEYPATVHGAYLSGETAARALLRKG